MRYLIDVVDTRLNGDGRRDLDTAWLPENVRSFRPSCPNCSPEVLLDPGSRPCSFYNCPRLPTQLQVTCDICVYDFLADNGTVKCDHNTCETARRLKANVPTYRAWLRLLEEEHHIKAGF